MFFAISRLSRLIPYILLRLLTDAGAKVATDWAIARSLSALNRAEDAGKLKESQAQLEVQDEGDEDDNEKDDDDDVEGSV